MVIWEGERTQFLHLGCLERECAWAVDQSLNLDRSIDRSKAYVNLWYSGPLMIRSIAENCTARSNFDYGIHFRSTVM